jgi:probable rRNA maturation factor
VLAALRHTRRKLTELNVVFVNDSQLTSLHSAWLKDETRTDVITFDLSSGRERMGELYVSVPCAYRVARERGVTPSRELALYVVHGVLHLCGHDDVRRAERARMRVAERAILRRLGYEEDRLPHP